MDKSQVVRRVHVIQDEAKAAVAAAKAMKSIVNAPPDPNPRHRWNILSHRMGELDSAVENIANTRDALNAMLERERERLETE